MYQINFVEGIPVYQQIVDRIRANIKHGVLENGIQLPTVRELSQFLNVAQGTVKRAYDELQKEELVRQIQGRGTFVSYQKVDPGSRKEQAMAAIDTMLEQLRQMEFSLAETKIFLDLKLREWEGRQEKLKVAVVDCNPEVLSQIVEQLLRLPDVDLCTYLLEDVQRYPYKLAEEMDLIVTTVSHAEELLELMSEPKKIVRIALRVQPRCVAQLVKIPEDATVGLLSGSERYGILLEQACSTYAEYLKVLQPQQLGQQTGIGDLLEQVDAVLLPEQYEKFCTQQEKEQLDDFACRGTLVTCAYQIDEGSFMYLEEKIQRLRSKRKL